MARAHIHITGIVQGVGMRPFVYREAVAHGVSGWVLNAGDGVHIEAHADAEALRAFTRDLRDHAPTASRIDGIEVVDLNDAEGEGERGAPGLRDNHAAREGGTAGNATTMAGQAQPADLPFTPSDAGAPPFRIIASRDERAHTTLVSPDIATCNDCLRELFDPSDRRFHYPFINCTNCGPRFTIIRGLPYDRAQTSMRAFPLCPTCAEEYADPANRRFHAQPNACFTCGPHITWRERGDAGAREGGTREESDAIIERCAEVIEGDGIVAIKGLGGFHLACRADSERAVRELRRRKHRGNKPLAIMVRTVSTAERFCRANRTERDLLTGSVRPIVLLTRRTADEQPRGTAPDNAAQRGLAPYVAFDLPEVGVMLPYTPLQHLLMAACEAHGVDALVMTSGNVSEEPIEMDDARAWHRLVEGGIADALLGNDRAILSRFDDSVARIVHGDAQLVRRARGYAPRPVTLPALSAPASLCVLACGPEQKGTLALTREQPDGTAVCFVSPHIGDLENAETLDAWQEMRAHMGRIFDLQPTALACDAHPGYLSSQWAREQARHQGLELIEVQHHHAHIAAVIAEAAARGEHRAHAPVIGIALDGTGAGAAYGDAHRREDRLGSASRLEGPGHSPCDEPVLDGTIWGGEVLLATLSSFERVAHLEPWPLPGGGASVHDPRRNAFALLAHHGLLDHPGAADLLASLGDGERKVIARMIERGVNCPLTSSMGRLLDALAAILGISHAATYEGEPAIMLEAAAHRRATAPACDRPADPMPGAASPAAGAARRPSHLGAAKGIAEALGHAPGPGPQGSLNVRPLLVRMLDGAAQGVSSKQLAWEAHQYVIDLVAAAARDVSRAAGIRSVALSGGVFMNRLLLGGITSALEQAGLTVLTPRELPFNDGCIAYGQAAVARARLALRSTGADDRPTS